MFCGCIKIKSHVIDNEARIAYEVKFIYKNDWNEKQMTLIFMVIIRKKEAWKC